MRARDRAGHISPAVLRGLCLQPDRRDVRQLLGRPLGHVIAVSIPLQNHLFHTHTQTLGKFTNRSDVGQKWAFELLLASIQRLVLLENALLRHCLRRMFQRLQDFEIQL